MSACTRCKGTREAMHFRGAEALCTPCWTSVFNAEQAAQNAYNASLNQRARYLAGVVPEAAPAARPVRVGDMVTWGRCVETRRVSHVGPYGVLAGEDEYRVTWEGNMTGTALRHQDGAPIDVAASLTPEKAAKCQALIQGEVDRLTSEAAEKYQELFLAAMQADLEAARKRIAELEAERDDLFARGNLLSDTSGLLETEKRELLVENATLRRTIERIERDAKRGRR